MAAAASSLKSQATELVQAVAFFKVNGHTGSSLPRTAVRAPASSDKPFKGDERRAIGAAGAARKPSAVRPAAAKPTATTASAAPKTQTKAAPAGGDEDWETF